MHCPLTPYEASRSCALRLGSTPSLLYSSRFTLRSILTAFIHFELYRYTATCDLRPSTVTFDCDLQLRPATCDLQLRPSTATCDCDLRLSTAFYNLCPNDCDSLCPCARRLSHDAPVPLSVLHIYEQLLLMIYSNQMPCTISTSLGLIPLTDSAPYR